MGHRGLNSAASAAPSSAFSKVSGLKSYGEKPFQGYVGQPHSAAHSSIFADSKGFASASQFGNSKGFEVHWGDGHHDDIDDGYNNDNYMAEGAHFKSTSMPQKQSRGSRGGQSSGLRANSAAHSAYSSAMNTSAHSGFHGKSSARNSPHDNDGDNFKYSEVDDGFYSSISGFRRTGNSSSFTGAGGDVPLRVRKKLRQALKAGSSSSGPQPDKPIEPQTLVIDKFIFFLPGIINSVLAAVLFHMLSEVSF